MHAIYLWWLNLLRWLSGGDPCVELVTQQNILIRQARRCAYDLRHAIDCIPDDDPLRSELQSRCRYWTGIFEIGSNGVKDYRIELERQNEMLKDELEAAEEMADDRDKTVATLSEGMRHQQEEVVRLSTANHSLQEQKEALSNELERERLRLAACGVVAMANARDAANAARQMDDTYRSASLRDVECAVDREMDLREQLEQANETIARLHKEKLEHADQQQSKTYQWNQELSQFVDDVRALLHRPALHPRHLLSILKGQQTKLDELQADKKPAPSNAPIYAVIYPGLATIARKHGYALAVHGSMQRDFDLIAVPWVEHPSEPEAVVRAFTTEFDLRVVGDIGHKLHRRTVYSISLSGDAAIDLSFMPCEVPSQSQEPKSYWRLLEVGEGSDEPKTE